MQTISSARRRLTDDTSVPWIGLGGGGITNDRAGGHLLEAALKAGYGLIDTAQDYGNEVTVGAVISEHSPQIGHVRVISKLSNKSHGYENTIAAAEASRVSLGAESLDIYLIHWPLPAANLYLDSYSALVDLQRDGRIRTIGTSNFTVAMLDQIERRTGMFPPINQVELHPYLQQGDLLRAHQDRAIQTLAWSPLNKSRGQLLDDATLREIARRVGRSPAQVVLRWHIARDTVPIVRAHSLTHLTENLDLDFGLSAKEMETIKSLDRGARRGPDPAAFNG